jgi:hypothetical protein
MYEVLLQNTTWTEVAAPASPAAGFVAVYAKLASGELCSKSSAGIETCMSAGGGGGGNNWTTIGTATADAAGDTMTITDTLSIDMITANDPEDLSAAFRYDQTLAGDPALAVEQCIFSTDGTGGGGLICEGTGANADEQLHMFPPSDGANTTDFITTTTAAPGDDQVPVGTSTANSAAIWKSVPNCGETGTLNYDTATNAFSCLTDGPAVVETEVDFGATGAFDSATPLTVTATWVTATSVIVCAPTMFATADRLDGSDDALLDEITVAPYGRVVGVSFDVKAHAPNRAFGKFKIHCAGGA